MSALPDSLPRWRRMVEADLDAVLEIENAVYTHPWTRGNFTDSFAAGYHCWVMECRGTLSGYGVVAVAAGEAHLLNLSIAADRQRRGLGSELLRFMLKLARDYGAERLFLEVRASNQAAQELYVRQGFARIAVRRGYYPATSGREDAVVMEKTL